MTSLRVALKLSMAENQSTPNAANSSTTNSSHKQNSGVKPTSIEKNVLSRQSNTSTSSNVTIKNKAASNTSSAKLLPPQSPPLQVAGSEASGKPNLKSESKDGKKFTSPNLKAGSTKRDYSVEQNDKKRKLSSIESNIEDSNSTQYGRIDSSDSSSKGNEDYGRQPAELHDCEKSLDEASIEEKSLANESDSMHFIQLEGDRINTNCSPSLSNAGTSDSNTELKVWNDTDSLIGDRTPMEVETVDSAVKIEAPIDHSADSAPPPEQVETAPLDMTHVDKTPAGGEYATDEDNESEEDGAEAQLDEEDDGQSRSILGAIQSPTDSASALPQIASKKDSASRAVSPPMKEDKYDTKETERPKSQSDKAATKLKGKKTPSKPSEPPPPPPQGADSASDDNSTRGVNHPRQTLPRSAAKIANAKLTTKSKSADEEDAKQQHQHQQAHSMEWVMCDRCQKWRRVDPHAAIDFSRDWFCKMNTWNSKYNHCDAPEEPDTAANSSAKNGSKTVQGGVNSYRRRGVPEDIAGAEKERESRAGVVKDREGGGGGGRGGGRGMKGGRWGNRRRRSIGKTDGDGGRGRAEESGSDDGEDDGADGADFPALRGQKPSKGGTGNQAKKKLNRTNAQQAPANQTQQHIHPYFALGNVEAEISEWVQCNKCEKWRKVPKSIDVKSLPEKWFCSLNTWVVPSLAKCSVRQEEDDTNYSAMDVVGNAASTRARRGNVGGGNGSISNSQTIEMKNIQWVQCEGCKKWRKVPASIDCDSFPHLWYCNMNTWDLQKANCDAIADDEEEEQQKVDLTYPSASGNGNKKPASSSQNLITANSKGTGQLSYRRIIFGADGKIRSCFSDKNKNGFGLFSFPEVRTASSAIGSRLLQLQRDPQLPSNVEQDSGELKSTDEVPVVEGDPITVAGTHAVVEYPVRRVSYWWSSSYDESAAAFSAVNNALNTSISNVAISDHTMDPLNAGPVHASLPGSGLIHALQKLAGCGDASEMNLDTLREHMSGMDLPPLAWRKAPRSWRLVKEMTILQRDLAECCAVRSCFLLTPALVLTMPLLLSLLGAVKFQNEDVDAVREVLCMDKSCARLRHVLRRLEERGEAEVAYTNAGELSIQLFTALNCAPIPGTMHASSLSSAVVGNSSNGKPLKGFGYRNSYSSTNNGQEDAKRILPLKLRKFFDSNGRLRSDKPDASSSSTSRTNEQTKKPQPPSKTSRGAVSGTDEVPTTGGRGHRQSSLTSSAAKTNSSIKKGRNPATSTSTSTSTSILNERQSDASLTGNRSVSDSAVDSSFQPRTSLNVGGEVSSESDMDEDDDDDEDEDDDDEEEEDELVSEDDSSDNVAQNVEIQSAQSVPFDSTSQQ